MNFKEITDWIRTNQYDDKKSVIKIQKDNIIREIMPFADGGGCYFRMMNFLEIKSDSILVENGYKIEKLDSILNLHYTNNGKSFYYADSPKRAIVKVTIDTSKTGTELKDFLIKLTTSFDKINFKDSLELRLMFDYFRQTPRPPAPPAPVKLEDY